MDFSLEEASELMFEFILTSGLIGVCIYYFANCHKF